MKSVISWAASCLGGFVLSILADGIGLIPVAAIMGLAGGDKKRMAMECFVSAILMLTIASVLYFVHYARRRRNFDYPHRLLTAAYGGFAAGLAVIAVFMIVTVTATGEGIITGF